MTNVKQLLVRTVRFIVGILSIFTFSLQNLNASPPDYFKIKIVDEETGRGIPLVEVRTQSWIRYFSDSNGLVAFYEPSLMDQDSYLFIESEGYEYPKDMLGNAGIVINPSKSDSIVIRMNRVNIAERLYRITGPGIYRDSYMLGVPSPLKNPLLNGKVLGQDSNLSLTYKGEIFWIWGDTFKPSYPWGNFSISAATSKLPKDGGLSPDIGVDLNYFVDSTGFSKQMITLKEKGYVWFDWLMVIPDNSGQEKLVAKYARVKTNFTNHERGIAVYNDQKKIFEKYRHVDEWIDEYHSTHHPLRAEFNGQEYAVMTSEFAFSRVKPDLLYVSNPTSYEAFSCLVKGSKYDKENPILDRDSSGNLVWDWKTNTDVIDVPRQNELVASGAIKENERWLYLQDIANGELLPLRRSSIFWNEHRHRWILIVQKDMGEIWYAEGDTPTGPWVFAKKVLTHNQYFYNPVHHPFFDQENGKIIYFEGTYTNIFNANPVIKPRYEYNQLMYKLSLDDSRLFMPVPIYRVESATGKFKYQVKEKVDSNNNWEQILSANFFAYPPERTLKNLIPIYYAASDLGSILSTAPKGEILFYALPIEEQLNEKFLGTWKCEMTDGVFLNQQFNLSLDTKKRQVEGTIKNAGYSVTNVTANDGSLEFNVIYVDKTYQFQGEVNAGRMKGTWTNPNNSSTGTWEGEIIDHHFQPVHSPLLVPLYVYTNNKSNWFYSVDIGSEYQSFLRSDEAICRVWKNPARNIKIEPAVSAEK
jgi:hypothetical protein